MTMRRSALVIATLLITVACEKKPISKSAVDSSPASGITLLTAKSGKSNCGGPGRQSGNCASQQTPPQASPTSTVTNPAPVPANNPVVVNVTSPVVPVPVPLPSVAPAPKPVVVLEPKPIPAPVSVVTPAVHPVVPSVVAPVTPPVLPVIAPVAPVTPPVLPLVAPVVPAPRPPAPVAVLTTIPVSSWQNPTNRFDVNGDGQLNSKDIEFWNRAYAEAGNPLRGFAPSPMVPSYLDVDGNRMINNKDGSDLFLEVEARFNALPPDAFGLKLMSNGNYRLACGNKLPGTNKSLELNSLPMGATTCETGRQIGDIKILRNDRFQRCALGSSVYVMGTKLAVNYGCDGEFEIINQVPPKFENGKYVMECKSLGRSRHECDFGRAISNVTLQTDYTTSYGCSAFNPRWGNGGDAVYGFSGSKVWVSGGCHAKFIVTPASAPTLLPNGNYEVECDVLDKKKSYCDVGVPIESIRQKKLTTVKTPSREECQLDASYPYEPNAGYLGTKVWVKNCIGLFEVEPRKLGLPAKLPSTDVACYQGYPNYPVKFGGVYWSRTSGEGHGGGNSTRGGAFSVESCADVCGAYNVDEVAMREIAGSQSSAGVCKALYQAFYDCRAIQPTKKLVVTKAFLQGKTESGIAKAGTETSEPCGFEYTYYPGKNPPSTGSSSTRLLRGAGYTDQLGRRIETESDVAKSGTGIWDSYQKVSRNYFCACDR
jgi:hypothetical protein